MKQQLIKSTRNPRHKMLFVQNVAHETTIGQKRALRSGSTVVSGNRENS